MGSLGVIQMHGYVGLVLIGRCHGSFGGVKLWLGASAGALNGETVPCSGCFGVGGGKGVEKWRGGSQRRRSSGAPDNRTKTSSFEQRSCPGGDPSGSLCEGGKALHGSAGAEQRCKVLCLWENWRSLNENVFV